MPDRAGAVPVPDAARTARGGAAPAATPPAGTGRAAIRPARVTLTAGLLALGCAAAFLAAPPLGTDLSAQVARASFFHRHGAAPVDFGWYGGVSPYGYSPLTPPLMSWLGPGTLGPRIAGALALLVAAVAFALLLVRTAARRPLPAALLGAVCIAGNLVSGRVTYAIGVAFGLLALLALTLARRGPRLATALPAAVLAGAASPVAGLFAGLAGAALVLGAVSRSPAGRRSGQGRAVDGLLLALAAAVPVAGLGFGFGAGGWMNISLLDAARAGTASLAVALLVPLRPVRAGALLATLGVAAACAVHTPVGLNATRLAAMFTLPVLVGYAPPPAVLARRLGRSGGAWALAALLAVLAVWQPPVSVADLRAAGDPTAARGYFRPLLDELRRRGPARVEVVPTANYWEAAYVPEAAPLARGWLRQADQAYHRLFLDGSVDADSYAAWLRDNGVGYVALAGAKPSWVGRREAELVRAGLPYLTPVWRGGDWTLYAVAEPTSIVAGAELVAADAAGVTFDAPAGAGEVLVRVRWSRWLRLTGPTGPVGPVGVAGSRAVVRPGCLAPQGEWTTVRVSQPGRYVLSGSLTAAGPFCPDR
ncbi:hypothetical protein AB0J86_30870 [Micromonospora sp. NPDC049559]|uniref:hypothetical protein n=1 Tax=Micromonospora sp. NPDC049559 TaxID=3155923 RepID=UPI0034354C0D